MLIKKTAFLLILLAAVPMLAQAPPPYAPPPAYPAAPPPPMYTPAQLDGMVARIALYPDSLVAQILAASTYPDQIPDAASWASQHHYLTGQALANAIQEDQVPWDPSVQALLPFPSVLDMMARDMNWTSAVGTAFMAQQPEVMEAVQRERRRAYSYGYLRSSPQLVVSAGPYITIVPANPAFVPVPWYDPAVVYVAPRPGFFVGGAIRLGYGITIGAFFRPWGWGYNRVDWGTHVVVINNAPWHRTWANRVAYAHPYSAVRRYAPAAARPPERHELHEQSERERAAVREGRVYEEHGHDDHGHDERR